VILNLLLNLVLLPRYGIVGAALTSSITYTLAATLLLAIVSRDSGVPFRHFFEPRLSELAALLPGRSSSR
jgi:O-antigen/teichoic acid export membrane protein